MPSTNSLLSSIRADFPQFTFEASDHFRWSSADNAVFFDPHAEHADAFILHELSHAVLGHGYYHKDIDLVKLERDAWQYAQQHLAKKYGVAITEDIVQDNLDTYRDWLHARSTCPRCHASGIQEARQQYKCIACGSRWRVNEARICGLKRHAISEL